LLAPNRVLVPVHGDEADEQALRLACGLVKKTKGKVFALYIVEVERSLPLESIVPGEEERADKVLQRMELIGKEEKCAVEPELIQAREAGPAVVEEAFERDVDLIIMGLSYRRHRGEFGLGTTVPYVMMKAQCRVWVSREPASTAAPNAPVADRIRGTRLGS